MKVNSHRKMNMENNEEKMKVDAIQDAKPQVETKDELVKLLEQDFASGVTKVYVNSLDKEIAFKEITVT